MRTLSIILQNFMLLLFFTCHLAVAETETLPHSEKKIKKDELRTQVLTAELMIKTEKSWDGVLLPHYPSQQPEITVLRLTVPPKTRLPVHKHPLINIAYLTKGELTFFLEDDSKSITLKPGDVDIEVVKTWNYGVNNGDTPAELIAIYLGTKAIPLSINKYENNP
ncbi:cupin domain-containing protein [Shewanella surugensis]|uniref:Cupin domain-containing protein n=1 Tax=Shewanella surugensis TaxID=212020 RepID=A0ABT0LJL5_9GAMM|nr:cupin domain-containing protein [Shewanella surugensis]MCL1127912.1 cupin domain-containing protein [Shewanella surugensis]